jgi:glutamate/tyrosine decarboxylase-like PLP-dependent enzyme
VYRTSSCSKQPTTWYLGSTQESLTLNFSRPAAQLAGQYYMLLRRGVSGYAAVARRCAALAARLAAGVAATRAFTLMSDDHSVPLVAFTLSSQRGYDEHAVSDALHARARWVVPAYPMAPHAAHITLLRAVVRDDFTGSCASSWWATSPPSSRSWTRALLRRRRRRREAASATSSRAWAAARAATRACAERG